MCTNSYGNIILSHGNKNYNGHIKLQKEDTHEYMDIYYTYDPTLHVFTLRTYEKEENVKNIQEFKEFMYQINPTFQYEIKLYNDYNSIITDRLELTFFYNNTTPTLIHVKPKKTNSICTANFTYPNTITEKTTFYDMFESFTQAISQHYNWINQESNMNIQNDSIAYTIKNTNIPNTEIIVEYSSKNKTNNIEIIILMDSYSIYENIIEISNNKNIESVIKNEMDLACKEYVQNKIRYKKSSQHKNIETYRKLQHQLPKHVSEISKSIYRMHEIIEKYYNK